MAITREEVHEIYILYVAVKELIEKNAELDRKKPAASASILEIPNNALQRLLSTIFLKAQTVR